MMENKTGLQFEYSAPSAELLEIYVEDECFAQSYDQQEIGVMAEDWGGLEELN